MVKLTAYEKETLLLFNEESDAVFISTYNKPLKKKMRKYSNKYPEAMRFISESSDGEAKCEILKERLSISFKPIRKKLTDEEVKEMLSRFGIKNI